MKKLKTFIRITKIGITGIFTAFVLFIQVYLSIMQYIYLKSYYQLFFIDDKYIDFNVKNTIYSILLNAIFPISFFFITILFYLFYKYIKTNPVLIYLDTLSQKEISSIKLLKLRLKNSHFIYYIFLMFLFSFLLNYTSLQILFINSIMYDSLSTIELTFAVYIIEFIFTFLLIQLDKRNSIASTQNDLELSEIEHTISQIKKSSKKIIDPYHVFFYYVLCYTF